MVANEIPLVMPKMSMTMTEGTFVSWHKAEGDQVRAGEVVCEVATDKVDMEVESTADGTLSRLIAAPDDVIAVGEPIAYLRTTQDDLLAGLFDVDDSADPVTTVAATEFVPDEPAPVADGTRALVPSAVPAARRRAAERGIDLADLTPTGPWHTIRLSDVDKVAPHRRSRAAIARRMAKSAEVPQFVLQRELDLTVAAQRRGGRSWTVLLMRAYAAALRAHPALNARWAGADVVPCERVQIALAVDTEHGLLAPVLTDPDQVSLAEAADLVRGAIDRARTGRLAVAELNAPASAALSNLGGLGVDAFAALLAPPQASALAVGVIREKVTVLDGVVGTRLSGSVALTVDHRVADGADAARLLGTLQGTLDGAGDMI